MLAYSWIVVTAMVATTIHEYNHGSYIGCNSFSVELFYIGCIAFMFRMCLVQFGNFRELFIVGNLVTSGNTIPDR